MLTTQYAPDQSQDCTATSLLKADVKASAHMHTAVTSGKVGSQTENPGQFRHI
jgi:hypothetical protein